MHWHKFSKWSEPYNATHNRKYGDFGVYHKVDIVMQERKCSKCGLVITRRIRDGKIEEADDANKG